MRANFLLVAVWLATQWVSSPSLAGTFQDEKEEVHIEAIAVTTVADDIDAGTGGLTVDSEGNLYTADFGWSLGGGGKGGDKIFRVTPEGDVKLFCGQMQGASGNTIDAEGNIYQSNIRGRFISKVSPEGKVTVLSKEGFFSPVGIALGDDGELFVCNCGNNTIQRLAADGTSSVFSKGPLFNCPNGIVRAKDGTLYVCNFGNGDVLKITPDGTPSRLATLPGNNNGHLTLFEDKLFVIARSDHRVYKIGLDGTATYFAGSGKRGKADGTPSESQFSLPNSIAPSPDGKYLYVNETSPTQGDPRILGPTRVRRIELRRTVGGPTPKEKVVLQPNPAMQKEVQKAQALLQQQDFSGAEKLLRQITTDYPDYPGPKYLHGYSLHALKRYDEALELYQVTQSLPRFKAITLYNMACAYSMLDKKEKAIVTLQAALDAGFSDLAQLKRDTDFDNIKDDPRFKELLPKQNPE